MHTSHDGAVRGAWGPIIPYIQSTLIRGASTCLSWAVDSSSPSQEAGQGREGMLGLMNLQ